MASEKAQIGAQSNGMQNEIRAAFGQVNVENDTSTQKTPIMSFSNGNVYIGLKLVSTFDQKNNVRREPVPRITASFTPGVALAADSILFAQLAQSTGPSPTSWRRWPRRWRGSTFRTPPSTTTWSTPRT